MVAYGLLILFVVDKKLNELNRWLPVYREIGWPTKLSQMGLDESHILQIVKKAVSVRDVVVSPYEITTEMLTDAIRYMETIEC